MGDLLLLTDESQQLLAKYKEHPDKPGFVDSFISSFLRNFCNFNRLRPSYGEEYDPVMVVSFVLILFSSIDILKIPPHLLRNFDETAICQAIRSLTQICIPLEGDSGRALSEKISGEKVRTTACLFISRDGQKLPDVHLYNSSAKKVPASLITVLDPTIVDKPKEKHELGIHYTKVNVETNIAFSGKTVSTNSKSEKNRLNFEDTGDENEVQSLENIINDDNSDFIDLRQVTDELSLLDLVNNVNIHIQKLPTSTDYEIRLRQLYPIDMATLRNISKKGDTKDLMLNIVEKHPKYKDTLLGLRIRNILGEKVTTKEVAEIKKNSPFNELLEHSVRSLIGGWLEGKNKVIDYLVEHIKHMNNIGDAIDLIYTLEKSEYVQIMLSYKTPTNDSNDKKEDTSDQNMKPPENVNDPLSPPRTQKIEALAIGHPTAYVCNNNIDAIVGYSLFDQKFPPLSKALTKSAIRQSLPTNTPNSKKRRLDASTDEIQEIIGLETSSTITTKVLVLPPPSLLLLDNFTSHHYKDLNSRCDDNRLLMIYFPPNMTWFLQPLDLTVNLAVKSAIRNITATTTNMKIEYPDLDTSYLNKMERRIMQSMLAFQKVKVSSIVNGFNTMFKNMFQIITEIKNEQSKINEKQIIQE